MLNGVDAPPHERAEHPAFTSGHALGTTILYDLIGWGTIGCVNIRVFEPGHLYADSPQVWRPAVRLLPSDERPISTAWLGKTATGLPCRPAAFQKAASCLQVRAEACLTARSHSVHPGGSDEMQPSSMKAVCLACPGARLLLPSK